MSTVSFSSPTYTVSESSVLSDMELQVTVTRSGATDTTVVVLVATDASQGNASGNLSI